MMLTERVLGIVIGLVSDFKCHLTFRCLYLCFFEVLEGNLILERTHHWMELVRVSHHLGAYELLSSWVGLSRCDTSALRSVCVLNIFRRLADVRWGSRYESVWLLLFNWWRIIGQLEYWPLTFSLFNMFHLHPVIEIANLFPEVSRLVIWRYSVLAELGFVFWDHSRSWPCPYKSRPWSFVKHPIDLVPKNQFCLLPPLLIISCLHVVDSPILFSLYCHHKFLWVRCQRLLDRLPQECIEGVP